MKCNPILYKYRYLYMYIDLHRKKFGMTYSKIFTVVMVIIKKKEERQGRKLGLLLLNIVEKEI